MTPDDRDDLDQCALRLPFHVNGTLDPAWQQTMRNALSRSESLSHSAAWLAALRTEMRAASIWDADQTSWERIEQSIDRLAKPDAEPSSMLAFATRHRWRIAAAAITLVAALDLTLIGRT